MQLNKINSPPLCVQAMSIKWIYRFIVSSPFQASSLYLERNGKFTLLLSGETDTFLHLQHDRNFSRRHEDGQKACKVRRKLELNENRITGLIVVLRDGNTKNENPRIHLHLSLIKKFGKVIFKIK